MTKHHLHGTEITARVYWTEVEQLSDAILSLMVADGDGLLDARYTTDEIVCDHPWLGNESSMTQIMRWTKNPAAIFDEFDYDTVGRKEQLTESKDWTLRNLAFFAMLEDVDKRINQLARMHCWIADFGNDLAWRG